ncbi:AAA-ATPase At3g50940-like [Vicia villosa]|uniref:AAA-ATPase At3g50940-like n=1 Tax=Vicia villosa TaxID=3911 RepID=UPI00273B0AB0|nr:AAA-ATPase At3g50940-like [Vicia villosa]
MRFPSPLTVVSTLAVVSTVSSLATAAALFHSLLHNYLPHELYHYLRSKLSQFTTSLSNELTTIVIDEYDRENLAYNRLFQAAELYLHPDIAQHPKRFKAVLRPKEKNISVVIHRNDEIIHRFIRVDFKWRLIEQAIPPTHVKTPGTSNEHHVKSSVRRFEVRFNKKHRDMALSRYFPFLMENAEEIQEERMTLKLFTLSNERVLKRFGNAWQSVALDHPASFETLAMDNEFRNKILDDLDMFRAGKELYKRVGKPWKRGYLLYGPPGCGKSSLIAAMASYLIFDVYDLQLSDVQQNNELRSLLMSIGNRSILVVEDIDCTVELHNRRASRVPPWLADKPPVTLSGFLNFIDGLWSSCGEARVIVITTNHIDKLDPAILRPGRMDVHISLSYCNPSVFRELASNYLEMKEHPLFVEVDKLLEKAKITPAEVGEHFLQNEDPEVALRSLVELLEKMGRNHCENEVIKEDVTTYSFKTCNGFET